MKAILLLALICIAASIELHGIDLSAWDDTVYWDILKTEVDFVILRAGYGTSGTIDALYEEYYQKCKDYEIPVGAYWFAYATSVEGAEIEAYNFIDAMAGKKFEYPVYYDIEYEDTLEQGKEVVSAMLDKFCSILESQRYYCGIYASKSALEEYFTDYVLDKYDIWLAHYASSTSYKGHKIWQYTDTGRLNGKPGDCDLNICYYDYPPLIINGHFNGY